MKIIDSFKNKYEFLSNFYPVQIVDKFGIIYPSVEHAFVASKTFDLDLKKNIAEITTASDVKKFGRTIDLRPDWDRMKVEIMYNILTKKFEHPDLADKLLKTNGSFLVEGNYWHDQFWGDCHCVKHAKIDGKNNLGSVLMFVRSKLDS